MAIGFKPVSDQDLEFLHHLYASTRAEEMATMLWTQQQKEDFLLTQFNAQHQYYKEQYSDAEFNLIIDNSAPIGRLYLDESEQEIRVIDIALLPENRESGIGTCLLQDILEDAASKGKCVRIHVLKHNRACRLYQRLGFIKIEDHGVHNLMEWRG